MKKSTSGFTIVELLIVIIIIAILAAITIVAYSGIQRRASNDQIIAAARVYKQAFSLYVTQNGQLPPTNGGSSLNYCLAHSVATCVNASSVAYWNRDTTTLEPALKTTISTLPVPNYTSNTYSSNDPNMGFIPYRGGTNQPTLDGVNSAFLIYILDGTTTCPVGPVAGGGWPAYTSNSSTGYTWQSGIATACWIPLQSS